MTVLTQVTLATGSGNGSATVFSFSPFVVFANSELVVTLVTAAGVETPLSEGTGAAAYSVIIASLPGTGSIQYPEDEVTPIAAGVNLKIKRVLVLEQQTDLENQGGYFPEVQEEVFDKLVMIMMQIQEELDRAITIPIGDISGVTSLQLPVPVAGKTFEWDPTAKFLVSANSPSDATAAAAVSAAAALVSENAAAADAILTAADLVLTNADVVSTAADAVSTAADVISAAASDTAAQSSEDDAQTSETAAAASESAAATSASNASTSASNASTSATAAQSSEDDAQISEDAAAADAILTAADLVLTNADVVSTGLDAVSTAADVVSTAADVLAIDVDAASGIVETNATFVAPVIFGPALDPKKDWHKPLGSSVATALMLATIEDTGADTQLNIFDLTSSTIAAAVPLATLTITGAATPTSLHAAMGYIIIGSEDGVTIIDPHDGAWAERTEGWPKSVSASTAPALVDNSVLTVHAGFSNKPAKDPRTGGPVPTFAVQYAAGAAVTSLIKDDGNIYDDTTNTAESLQFVMIADGYIVQGDRSGHGARIERSSSRISEIVADNWDVVVIASAASKESNTIHGNNKGLAYSPTNRLFAYADDDGLSFSKADPRMGYQIDRTYSAGWAVGDVRGMWLANSKTVDRVSGGENVLTENGTVPSAAVESGAELLAYGPFTGSNYFSRALDTDFQIDGTPVMMGWFKSSGTATVEVLCSWSTTNANQDRYKVRLSAAGLLDCQYRGSSGTKTATSVAAFDDSKWHMFVAIGGTAAALGKGVYLYVDGILVGTADDPSNDFTGDAQSTWTIGIDGDGTDEEALTTQLSLIRLTATEPTADQIRHMYETERKMFVASAKCLLQSATTDAVLEVSIDPATGKVAATQTDSVTIWDGLVVDSEPTIATGGTTWEHYHIYGDVVVEINDANLFVSVAARSIRRDLENLRGLLNITDQSPGPFKSKEDVLFDLGIANHDDMDIDDDGQVGIGTTNQTAPLALAATRDGDGTTTAPKFNVYFPIASIMLKNADANHAVITDSDDTELSIAAGTDVLLGYLGSTFQYTPSLNPNVTAPKLLVPLAYEVRYRLWWIGDLSQTGDSSTAEVDLRCKISGDADADAYVDFNVIGGFDHQTYNARYFFVSPWMRGSESHLSARNSKDEVFLGVRSGSSNSLILTKAGIEIAYVYNAENI